MTLSYLRSKLDAWLADKTGSPNATTGILVVGDVFGNVPQTLQVRQHFANPSVRIDHPRLTDPVEFRVPISLPTVAKAPINTKSLSRTSCRANTPVHRGFRLTRKRRRKPLALSLLATRISERRRGRFPPPSRKSSRRQTVQSPSGRLWDSAGVERYE